MAGGLTTAAGGSTSLQGGAATNGDFTGGSSAFDSSGWNINFGSGGIESTRKDATALDSMALYGLLAALAIAGLVALRLTRRGK